MMNSNMAVAFNRDIRRIFYDDGNMPRTILFGSESVQSAVRTQYTYDASGRKLRTQYIVPQKRLKDTGISSGTASRPPRQDSYRTTTIDYCGDNVYRDGKLLRTLLPTGYLEDDSLFFFVRDFQGNVRLVVREDGEVVESSEYYPYGALFDAKQSVQPYKYGEKELDRTHGLDWYDFGARMLDPTTLRTTIQDPHSEHYYDTSPYSWCKSNPLRYSDPNGMDVYKYDEEGHFSERIKKPGEDVYIRDLPEITVTPTDPKESAQSTGQPSTEPTENTAENPQSTMTTEEKVGMVVNGVGAVVGNVGKILKLAEDTSLNKAIKTVSKTSTLFGIAGTAMSIAQDVRVDNQQGLYGRAFARILVNGSILVVGVYCPMVGFGLNLVEASLGDYLYNTINF